MSQILKVGWGGERAGCSRQRLAEEKIREAQVCSFQVAEFQMEEGGFREKATELNNLGFALSFSNIY